MPFTEDSLGPTIGALTGLTLPDPFDDDGEPTLDPWKDDLWLWSRKGKEQRDPDQTLKAQLVGGSDFEGDNLADTQAKAMGADPASADVNLLQLARSQLGVEYVWAASDPGDGFDCSGFTQWVLKRYGISTAHKASMQQDQFKKLSREELQPGDLVFFNYGRLAAGVADHVGIYVGSGMMIDASSSNDAVVERAVDWDNFLQGGATGIEATRPGKKKDEVLRTPPTVDSGVSAARALTTGRPGDISSAVFAAMGKEDSVLLPPEKNFRGNEVKTQLYRGFMDAGRPDLANMVGTKEFEAWIRQESGWRPDATSPANNNGLANDGLFQVWRGHAFNDRGQVANMSPYEQAMLIARYFDLSVADIKRYADQISNDTYQGWG